MNQLLESFPMRGEQRGYFRFLVDCQVRFQIGSDLVNEDIEVVTQLMKPPVQKKIKLGALSKVKLTDVAMETAGKIINNDLKELHLTKEEVFKHDLMNANNMYGQHSEKNNFFSKKEEKDV